MAILIGFTPSNVNINPGQLKFWLPESAKKKEEEDKRLIVLRKIAEARKKW